jgi:hypothetical protein
MHKITRNFLASHTQGHDGSESEEDEPAPPRPLPPRKLVAPPPPAIHVPVPVTPNAAAGPSTPQSAPKTGGPGTGRKRGSYMKDGPTVYKLIKPCMRAIKDAKSDE